MTDKLGSDFTDGEITDLYILDEQNESVPVSQVELVPWGKWMDDALHSGRRVVGKSQVEDFHVTTMFTGCDHNWEGGPPILFESKVTEGGERRDIYTQRYRTWSEAEEGHEAVCEQMRELAEKL